MAYQGVSPTILLVTGDLREQGASEFSIGDWVRLKDSVKTPMYEWGMVTHRCVGKVTGNVIFVLFSLVSRQSQSISCHLMSPLNL